MTRPYDLNPMPHRLGIKCPDCGCAARFEFAEAVRIELAKDVAYFRESDAFEYRFFEDSSGSRWHGAIYYHGLAGETLASIKNLPEGYAPEDWDHGQYLTRGLGGDLGTVTCDSCGCRRKHALEWPEEAHFQIEHKGKVLWAFDRESAGELLDYVRSEDRDRQGFRWRSFLMHVPSHFLRKGAREAVSKKLKRLLIESPSNL